MIDPPESQQPLATGAEPDAAAAPPLAGAFAQERSLTSAIHVQVARLEAIYDLTAAISQPLDLREIYDVALDCLERTLQPDRSAISVVDVQGQMRFCAWRNLPLSYRRAAEGHSPWPLQANRPLPIVLPDAAEAPELSAVRDEIRRAGIRTIAFVPPLRRDRLIGKLVRYFHRVRPLTLDEIELAQTIAHHVAIAIDRSSREIELLTRDRAIRAARYGIAITDPGQPDNPIVHVNPAYLQMTGHSEPELLGKNPRLLQGPATDPQAVSTLRRAIARRESATVRLLNYRKSGEPFWNQVTVSPVFDDAGRLVNWVGIMLDVTETIEREERLRLISAAAEAATDGIAIVELAGTFVFANQALARLSGVASAREVIGQHWRQYFLPEDGSRIEEELWPVLRRNGSWQGELTVRTRAGATLPIEISLTRLGDDRIVMVMRDITRRRQVLAALQESETRLRTTVETILDGVLILDPEGRITYANTTAERILGRPREELLGRVPPWTWYAAPVTPPWPEARPILAVITHRRPVTGVKLVADRPDNGRVILSVNAAPMFVPDGRALGAVATFRDITALERAELFRRLEAGIARILVENLAIPVAGRAIVETLGGEIGWDRGELWLAEGPGGAASLAVLWLSQPEAQPEAPASAAAALAGALRGVREPQWITVPGSPPTPLVRYARELQMETLLVLPLMIGVEAFGWLLFFCRETLPPDIELLRGLAEIGREIASYIRRRHVERELEAAQQRLLELEVEKKRFYREMIRAVTQDRLRLADPGEIPTYGRELPHVDLTTLQDYPALRHRICEIALAAGMTPERADDFLIAVAEAITNAIKHAHGGEITLYATRDRLVARISDRGPGIRPEDLPATVLLRGYSTTVSLGMGFTIILRLADRVWLSTGPQGTTLQLEMWIHPESQPPTAVAGAWERL